MTETDIEAGVFVQDGRDGGTGKHRHKSFREAYDSVDPDDKHRAFLMLIAAGVTIAFMLFTRVIWLLEPVFDLIYYATLSEIIYYILLGLACTAYAIVLARFLRKHCGLKLFKRHAGTIGIPRTLGIIAVCAIAVLAISAFFGFDIKIQHEMGMGVTLNTALTNISVYFYYGFHMWLGFMAASLVQYGMSILLPAKYTVPWGAIFIVAVFGLLEYLFEALTTAHVYPEYYYIFTYAYAAIFVLAGSRLHSSYWASIIVMAL